MTTRQELLDYWRSRLCEAEAACDDPVTDSWAARVRRKLFRFLLTMYGQAPWPGPKDDVDNSAGRALHNQVFVADPHAELAGKEPRTRAQILRGLQNIQGLSAELAPAGPLTSGLESDSPMVVGAFKKLARAQVACRRLQRLGLHSEMICSGQLYQIFVAAADFDVASDILASAPTNQAVPLTPQPASGDATEPASSAVPVERPRNDILSLVSGLLYGVIGVFITLNVILNYLMLEPIGPAWDDDLTWIFAIVALALNVVSVCSLWNWWRWQRVDNRASTAANAADAKTR